MAIGLLGLRCLADHPVVAGTEELEDVVEVAVHEPEDEVADDDLLALPHLRIEGHAEQGKPEAAHGTTPAEDIARVIDRRLGLLVLLPQPLVQGGEHPAHIEDLPLLELVLPRHLVVELAVLDVVEAVGVEVERGVVRVVVAALHELVDHLVVALREASEDGHVGEALVAQVGE